MPINFFGWMLCLWAFLNGFFSEVGLECFVAGMLEAGLFIRASQKDFENVEEVEIV